MQHAHERAVRDTDGANKTYAIFSIMFENRYCQVPSFWFEVSVPSEHFPPPYYFWRQPLEIRKKNGNNWRLLIRTNSVAQCAFGRLAVSWCSWGKHKWLEACQRHLRTHGARARDSSVSVIFASRSSAMVLEWESADPLGSLKAFLESPKPSTKQ